MNQTFFYIINAHVLCQIRINLEKLFKRLKSKLTKL